MRYDAMKIARARRDRDDNGAKNRCNARRSGSIAGAVAGNIP
jgi:hypothetical protein